MQLSSRSPLRSCCSARAIARHTDRRGFALIITIVLVSFLVLILVGLATFSRVETTVADNAQDVSAARQNALQAMNIAIGQVQRHAGRDKATTARGDLFGHNDKRKNLTSVWNDDGVWGQRAWLVSGSETNNLANTLNEVVTPTTSPANDEITVVGSKSAQTTANYIVLKKQNIISAPDTVPGLAGAQKIGHYAYWVGDEGAKASLNVIDPTQANTVAPNYNVTTDWTNAVTRLRLNQQFLPQPQIANLRSELVNIDISDADTVDQLAKIGANASLRFVDNFPTATPAQRIRELFYDVTPRSEAVLADLTSGDGRLKIDYTHSSKITDPLVSAYASERPDASTDYTATHDFSATAYPVITEGGIRISFYLEGGQIKVSYAINLEVWNPYAATFRINNAGAGAEANPFTLEIQGLPDGIEIEEVDATNVVVSTTTGLDLDEILNWTGDAATGSGSFVTAFVNSGGNLDWAPGQIRELVSSAAVLVDSATTISPRVSNWQKAANPTATTLRVKYLGTNVLKFIIKGKNSGGTETIVTSYEPPTAFTPGTTSASAGSVSSYRLAYGYQLEDAIQPWAQTRDPRSPTLSAVAAFVDAHWTDNPQTVPSNLDGGTFAVGANPIVLFDLPRQEVVSIGQLRHVPGTGAPYSAANSLYDSNFFSTTPGGAWTSADIVAQPLPNRYVRVVKPIQVAAATETELRDGDISARYLLQTAAFNINSTSVAAWKALLGAKINGWRYGTTGASTQNLSHAFFRLGHGAQQLTNAPLGQTDVDDADMTVYVGGRELTSAAVTRLAEKIVENIKDHVGTVRAGEPFYTLQQFISSNVVRDAIQEVTDDTGLADADRINHNLAADRAGTPGQLTQGDIIAALAPLITPRSDTFKIRAYGDVYNPVTGETGAQAWCEAIIQRVPDIAENLTLAAGGAGNTVSNPNFTTYPFGRKFIVVSFRWLSSDDI